ncbi:extracellular matrix/biofilm biosynthesis regulator RemA family protein [Desulfitobacterium sp. THU1]|uniref:extracellular matrix regulator RemB n=1 Tax=Desulfitobacterium sp. THU1 TaxID=3138072 RepID=UPI00311DECCF
MFLHLGGDVLISQDRIIAILDLESAMQNPTSVTFLNGIKKSKNLNYISEPGKEKSLVITNQGNFFSPISSTTLLKRSNLKDLYEE